MKIDKSFLHSKLGRRIFIIFVSCALLPVAGLFILSLNQVTKHLHEQSQKRLKQSVKAHGLSLYERLLFLEAELQLFASYTPQQRQMLLKTADADSHHRVAKLFKALYRYDTVSGIILIFGDFNNPPIPSSAAIEHMRAGKTAIFTLKHPAAVPRIFMSLQYRLMQPEPVYLLGEIEPSYLWGTGDENVVPANTEICVLDNSRSILFSSIDKPRDLADQFGQMKNGFRSDLFELILSEEKYLASGWTMFLKPRFLVRSWTVVLMQSEADIIGPMSHFTRMFVLVSLMSLLIVLLLSIIYIRKSLIPLELLKNGTQQIAMKDFDHRVEVTSQDEFQQLADAFNDMAGQLSRQFKTLKTKAAIDRAILSSLKTEDIVKTVMTGMRDHFFYDAVSITVMDSYDANLARIYTASGEKQDKINEESLEIIPSEFQKSSVTPGLFRMDPDRKLPIYLSTLAAKGIKTFFVLPIFLKERLAAIITVGNRDSDAFSKDDIVQTRQMTDQVAVALANSQLLEELSRLNWGTLQALARAVDAKSSWTAGHSERVAQMVLQIGKVLQLSDKALEDLHRGALLHDIGKLGVPLKLLDKEDALSDEEYGIIKEHPRLGARILEPIKAYAAVIPMVLQHHERFDGRGYPDGLAGDEISLGGRILAVADVYDALISDRPYRNGWPLDRVVDLIENEAGRQFDPKVTNAFLKTIKWKSAQAA